MKEKLLILDGNSIANRAFYGVRILTNKDGLVTNAVYGFFNILLKYLEQDHPEYVCVAFDLKKPTFRHIRYDQYKAQRKGMPQELADQMPLIRQLLEAMNIPALSLEGYEADDIIGTVAKQCQEEGISCRIATGDRDSLQLATEETYIYLTSTKSGQTATQVMDSAAVQERYGVTPQQFIDVKGLMGDASDNIPGVAGIGEKTAVKLIAQYKSVEGVYEHLDELRGSVKAKLEQGRESAMLSKELATICTSVPLEQTISDLRSRQPDRQKLAQLLRQLEFRSFLKRLQLEEDAQAETVTMQTVLVEDEETALRVLKEMRTASYLIFSEQADIAAVAVCDGETCYYLNFGVGFLATLHAQTVQGFFEDERIVKYGHNCKDDIVLLNKHGISPKGIVFDTAIAGYVIDPAKTVYDLGGALGLASQEEFFGKGKARKSVFDIPASDLMEYAAACAGGIFRLVKEYTKQLEEKGQWDLFQQVEMPLVEVLASMEQCGFKVDDQKLKEFSAMLFDSISVCEEKIYHLAGEQFNINSPKQLGEILFEKLQLPVIHKTKSGYSTGIEVLQKLEEKHPIIPLIKEYRMLVKLKSTYADGLLQVIDPKDQKIHSKFNQTVTLTGRISSTDPNLQNIPVRLELGREIRKMFVAESEEFVLLDADYSQIELRVLAHISNDENMIQAVREGEDIHTITASQVFGVEKKDVTPLMRRNAKAVNFGIVYGISDFALAQDLKISVKQAKEYINGYLEKYHGVRQYMTDIVQSAKEMGFVTTLLGRRRYIPELKSQKFTERSFGERVALNTPIQGSAADIIKIAMIRVYQELKEKGLRSRLILQVHDELIVQTHQDEIEIVKELMKRNMEGAMELKVPLSVDVNQGRSWYDAK